MGTEPIRESGGSFLDISAMPASTAAHRFSVLEKFGIITAVFLGVSLPSAFGSGGFGDHLPRLFKIIHCQR